MANEKTDNISFSLSSERRTIQLSKIAKIMIIAQVDQKLINVNFCKCFVFKKKSAGWGVNHGKISGVKGLRDIFFIHKSLYHKILMVVCKSFFYKISKDQVQDIFKKVYHAKVSMIKYLNQQNTKFLGLYFIINILQTVYTITWTGRTTIISK